MANERKLSTYKTLRNLTTRIRDDLNSSDFVLLYAYNGTGKTRIGKRRFFVVLFALLVR
jgi:tRNA A37 threonylcarbamoyladenosine biosynthesis protein TsaE